MALVRARMAGKVREKLDPHNGQAAFEGSQLGSAVKRLTLHLAGVHHQPKETVPNGGVCKQLNLALNSGKKKQSMLALVAAQGFDEVLGAQLKAGWTP